VLLIIKCSIPTYAGQHYIKWRGYVSTPFSLFEPMIQVFMFFRTMQVLKRRKHYYRPIKPSALFLDMAVPTEYAVELVKSTKIKK
jgi:hypothetical protein